MPDTVPDLAPPLPVRLADYRPPDFLIDTVDLVFDLGDAETRVKSRLRLRRNPVANDRAAPLRLDGDMLELVALALDGEALGQNRWRPTPGGGLELPDVPDHFTLDLEPGSGPSGTPRSPASTCRAAISVPNASPRASAGSLISSTGRM